MGGEVSSEETIRDAVREKTLTLMLGLRDNLNFLLLLLLRIVLLLVSLQTSLVGSDDVVVDSLVELLDDVEPGVE